MHSASIKSQCLDRVITLGQTNLTISSLLTHTKRIWITGVWLSRGEICVANFIPPANVASQGKYFLAKIPKMAVFEAKMG